MYVLDYLLPLFLYHGVTSNLRFILPTFRTSFKPSDDPIDAFV